MARRHVVLKAEMGAGSDSARSVAAYVTAELSFFVAPAGGRTVYRPGTGLVEHSVVIHNGRILPHAPDLDREGFMLAQAATEVADFAHRDRLIDAYCPETERHVRTLTGAARTIAFDFTVRRNAAERSRGVQVPARRVHSDFTAQSGASIAAGILSRAGLSPELLRRRFAIFNVWRPICPVVLEWPLALCDAQTAVPADYIVTDLVTPDGASESYSVTFSPSQLWYYFPRMTTSEIIVIKTFDSAEDGRARFTPHGAFADPETPRDAPPRESIETRVLALFD
jgi:hypothetical protein